MEILSDDEDSSEDDIVTVQEDKYKPQFLEKMATLIAHLVEKSRNEENRLVMSDKDLNSLLGGKVRLAFHLVTLKLSKRADKLYHSCLSVILLFKLLTINNNVLLHFTSHFSHYSYYAFMTKENT